MINDINFLNFAISGCIIFFISMILVRLFSIYATKAQLLAIPNARSSHQAAVPLGAGVIFVIFWLIIWLLGWFFDYFSTKELLIFLPPTIMVSIIGYWDDHKNLTARKRLIAQLVASIFCVAMVGKVDSLHLFGLSSSYLGYVGIILTLLGFIWSTNLYNFMDGLDGLAAIEGVFVFGMGGVLFWHAQAFNMCLLCWFLVCVICGFLIWNWPKATVFMGDVGSYFLGFLVGLFSLIGDLWYNIPVAFWFILYSVFWFDATVTVIRRFCRKENLAVAHREHAFHRAHRLGLSHQQVLFSVIILNIIFSAMVCYILLINPYYLKHGLLLTLIILSIIYIAIEKLKPMAKIN